MKRPSLKRQLVLLFLGIMLPLSLVLGLLLGSAAEYSRERLATTMSGSLQSFGVTLEKQMSAAEKYLTELSLTSTELRGLSEQNNRTRAYLTLCGIAQGFPALLSANETLMGLILYDNVHNLYIGEYGSVYGTPEQQLEQKLALEQRMTRLGVSLNINTGGWYIETVAGRLYLLRSVVSHKSVLTVAIDVRLVFEELLHDYGLEGDALLCDEAGELLAGNVSPELLGSVRWRAEGYGTVQMDGVEQLVIQRSVSTMQLYYFLPYARQTVAVSSYEILLVCASLFVVGAIPFLLFYLRHEVLRPMGRLVQTMQRISSGDLSARPEQDLRNEEFTQVNETFNRMIDQITQLKIDRYEKELEARQNEMTALKLQIRPHFVLNCLKSVYGMVQTGSREDAQKLILLLSRYLRYILSFTLDTISLHDEVEQCRNYAELCGIGQPDPVELSCSINPELEDLPLPQVSLLTLVENSIKHGKVIGRPLRLTITAKLLCAEGERIANLTVADNGSGFSEQDLQQLNSALPQQEQGRHVGLHNVVRRLQLMYGSETAIAFANRNGGARIELFLPLKTAPEKKEEAE